jgi:hypothetical protein
LETGTEGTGRWKKEMESKTKRNDVTIKLGGEEME